MSGFAESLLDRARRSHGRVVLSEGDDERVREAALALAMGRVAAVTLLGTDATAAWAMAHAPGVSVRIPASDPSLPGVADLLAARKPQAVSGREAALALAADPLRFAAGLVGLGEAEATVGGAVHTTAEVLRAALWAVGPAPGITTVSSCFYMVTRTSGVLIGSLAYDLSADQTFYVTMMGVLPAQAAEFIEERGANIVALNCGTGMDMPGAAKVAEIYRQHCQLPVMVQPNAGLPVLEKGRPVYKQSPADMAGGVAGALAAGANIIGSCCGSTPEHTRAIHQVVAAFNQGK